jgi:hypothetical protein
LGREKRKEERWAEESPGKFFGGLLSSSGPSGLHALVSP